jgi:hypothetical protein
MRQIPIEGYDLHQFFWNGVPVVTYDQIALVHKVNSKTVRRAFNENTERFEAGKHFYRLDFTEASQLLASIEVRPSANGLIVFTERGYLLLVKPMRNDMAWRVQEMMIDAYFRVQDAQTIPPPETALDKLAIIVGFSFKKLQGEIASVDEKVESVAQNFRACLEDEQRTNDKRFKRWETHEQRRDEQLEEVKKTVEAMATVAAGPSPTQMVNTVRDFLKNRLEMLGLDSKKVPKLLCKAMKAYMRGHYPCRNSSGDEVYLQEDLRTAYHTPGYGTVEHSHLEGDERLKEEHVSFVEWCTRHPRHAAKDKRFPRSVAQPLHYKPPA